MSDHPKTDNKISVSVPFIPTTSRNKSKIREALENKEHLKPGMYVNAHKQIEIYRDAFKKEGHNILQNMKAKKNKSRRKK